MNRLLNLNWHKSLQLSLQKTALIVAIYGVLALITVSADVIKKVLQVDASLSIAQQVEFEKAPFVLLEGEPSTLAEEGLGGYKVELIAQLNQDQSYTLYSKIYNYTKSGYNLLGTPSIKLKYQSLGLIEFESEVAGLVSLQVEIVKQAEMNTEELGFDQMVR
ncbi:MAG: hypothetical protein JKY50_03080 [Oleispira sp.]|nr:hypothetical protein [Oleispira sp.]MBL4881665.1 hypothetical protein [Oleispira sp.]